MRRKVIPYNPILKQLARNLRNNSTQSEIKLWLSLKDRQMMGYDFHRQKPVDNYILDFFCHELMLGIELDGFTHHFEEVYEKDKKKEERLNELGITVLRFNDSDVMNNLTGVWRTIETWILEFEKIQTHPVPLLAEHPSQEGISSQIQGDYLTVLIKKHSPNVND
ncbi:MAG TPA: endonuclease domain-containing protein [Chitinophagales bacterium]|nr:endonuclease domain-containing protein [Chitinophagales bacterium]